MDVCTAKQIIDGLVFKPGWRFEVTDNRDRLEDTIGVRVHYPAHNYNREYAPDYCVPICPSTIFPVMVGPLDCEDALLFEVLKLIDRIDDHEHREALRIRRNGEWHAPFHPHNTATMVAWAQRSGRPIETDIFFGAY